MENRDLSPDVFNDMKRYLNEQQPAGVLRLAQVLAGEGWANEAAVTSIDANGIELQARDGERSSACRLDFAKQVDDPRGLQMTLMGLMMDADPPDGKIRTSTATVLTPKAGRYLKALCNHFDRKAAASYEEDDDGSSEGQVNFDFGRCTLVADGDKLELTVSAESDLRFSRTKGVVDSHLVRFATDENLKIDWVDG